MDCPPAIATVLHKVVTESATKLIVPVGVAVLGETIDTVAVNVTDCWYTEEGMLLEMAMLVDAEVTVTDVLLLELVAKLVSPP